MATASLGFSPNVTQNIKFCNDSSKLLKRKKRQGLKMIELLRTTLKILLNPLNIINKIHFNSYDNLDLNIKHLDNLQNSDLNNIMRPDFAIRDWIDDTDYVLPRICQEFPRISNSYTNFEAKTDRPWGNKSDPQYMNCFIDENIMRLNSEQYQKGIWYYTGYP